MQLLLQGTVYINGIRAKWEGGIIMTINQLQYYVEIVREKSFTRAAEKLFMSQSALSKSVRSLESEFQVELIDRASKDFLLTQDGLLFYDYAVKMLDFLNTQTRELHQRLHSPGGTLRIGIPPTAGAIYFHSLLSKFQKKYPGVVLEIEEIPSKKIHRQMDANKLDIGVVLEPFADSQYISKKVCTSEILLTVSKKHCLASRKCVAFSELRHEGFLMMSQDYMFHDIVLGFCKTAGFLPHIVFESSQWDLIYEMTADNQGVSFFPKRLLEKHGGMQVKQIRLKEPEAPWILSLIYRKDKFTTDSMRCFLEMCGEEQ